MLLLFIVPSSHDIYHVVIPTAVRYIRRRIAEKFNFDRIKAAPLLRGHCVAIYLVQNYVSRFSGAVVVRFSDLHTSRFMFAVSIPLKHHKFK